MNRRYPLIIGLLVLAASLSFWMIRLAAPVSTAEPAPPAPRTEPLRAEPVPVAMAEESAPVVPVPEAAEPAMSEPTAREQAVAAWESLVGQVTGQKDVPAGQSKQVKEVFDKLDKEDQKDGIIRAKNLFSDQQFPVLYAILFDKTEDPEVLDAIFSDALNRPEKIKIPLMQELRKNRGHPLYFEAARILDVVEPEKVPAAP